MTFLNEPGPSLGMFRDVPSWMIPDGGVYDSLNYVYDVQGLARQRMGSTNLVSGAQTALGTMAGFVYFRDSTPIEELYMVDGKAGDVNVINKTTGAGTVVISTTIAGYTFGRSVRHAGYAVFTASALPGGSTTRRCLMVAGQTTSTTFTSATAASVVAGNQQITLGGADVTTNVKVGAVVAAQGASNIYYGRVLTIDSATKFTVYPVPVATFSTSATGLNTGPARGVLPAGSSAASFQNRLLFADSNELTSTSFGLPADRRIIYSVLPTETSTFSGLAAAGALFQNTQSWPAFNYIEIPGSDPIVAMEPVADNQLLILTNTHPVIFSGNLVTQLATTSPTVTFDLSDINVNAGCLSDLSVQRTPRGVVWAGPGGIYAWDGRQPVDLTLGLVNTFWRSKVRGSSFAIHGAAYVRGCYILSYTSGGSTEAIVADLTRKQPKWGRMSGVGTDNFIGVFRPSDPSQVFAIRWWDQTGAAPSQTNGQTLRLESMLNPYTAGATTTDADGTAISTTLQTRTITGDPELQKVFHRVTARTQVSSTSASATLTAQSTIDAADTDASRTRALGSLSNTATVTLTNATNATPIVCTSSANHGLQTDDFVDIDAVLGNLNANGRYRIAVSNATTFSLVGSSGSAAYVSGGKVKKITEQDYLCSTLNEGQGVSLTIAASVNNIEVHGFRVACEQREPVMSA